MVFVGSNQIMALYKLWETTNFLFCYSAATMNYLEVVFLIWQTSQIIKIVIFLKSRELKLPLKYLAEGLFLKLP